MPRIRLVAVADTTGVNFTISFTFQQLATITLFTRQSTNRKIIKHIRLIREVSLVVAGIFLFAIFIHHSWPVRIIALGTLFASAIVISLSLRRAPLLEAFGIHTLNHKILLYGIVAILTGIGLGILSRNSFNLTRLPRTLTMVALVAPLVGIVEELIFRGYIQGHLHPIGRIFAIVYTSTVHTCYKLLVILSLSVPLEFDFIFLMLWTFMGGLLMGFLRELAKSTFPPMVAHAIFDIILYGGLTVAPYWVWS